MSHEEGEASARRLLAKLDIYRKFTNALAVSVIVSMAWIGYDLYFKETDSFSERWQSAWIISAFWHVLSFSLLCVICALWAPSHNTTRYSYSDDGKRKLWTQKKIAFHNNEVKMVMHAGNC